MDKRKRDSQNGNSAEVDTVGTARVDGGSRPPMLRVKIGDENERNTK